MFFNAHNIDVDFQENSAKLIGESMHRLIVNYPELLLLLNVPADAPMYKCWSILTGFGRLRRLEGLSAGLRCDLAKASKGRVEVASSKELCLATTRCKA